MIMDTGASHIKAGWSSDPEPKSIVPNCITKVKSERRRPFISDQLDDCKDYSGMFYILPMQKGYIVTWDLQKQIWTYVLKNKFNISDGLSEKKIILTEPYFNFRSAQENMIEIFFEEFGFGSLLLNTPATFAAVKYKYQNPNSLCCLIVDAGYSFTHIIPVIRGQVIKSGIRRIDVGGKALTNHLKDVISYRQLHVLDETFVMNQCKEDSCYVSLDFDADLNECRKRKNNCIARDYVLPDYTQIKRGYLRDSNDPKNQAVTDQQTIRMNNERIQIPELLFYPSDCGINQIGISHAIFHSVENLPSEVRPHMYGNILLMGGSSNFPGFRERILKDVTSLADALYDVKVTLAENPVTEGWSGAQILSSHLLNSSNPAKMSDNGNSLNDFKWLSFVTKKEYEENGPQAVINNS